MDFQPKSKQSTFEKHSSRSVKRGWEISKALARSLTTSSMNVWKIICLACGNLRLCGTPLLSNYILRFLKRNNFFKIIYLFLI